VVEVEEAEVEEAEGDAAAVGGNRQIELGGKTSIISTWETILYRIIWCFNF
jgi:hypothetical protein